MRQGMFATLIAAALFGVFGTVIVGIHMNGLVFLAASHLGAAIVTGAMMLRGKHVAFRVQQPKLLGLLVGLSIVQGIAYYYALSWAPIGPVSALRLSTPILLLLWALMRRHRRLGWEEGACLALLLIGIICSNLGIDSQSSGSHPVLGYILAGISAVGLAGIIVLFSHLRSDPHQTSYNLWSLVTIGLMTPILATAFPTRPLDLGIAILVGAVCIAPAVFLQIWSLRFISPTLMTSLNLTQVLWAVGLAWMIFQRPVELQHIVAALAIIGAIILELRYAARHPNIEQPHRKEPIREL